jgi:F0F1-type ATP synthase epsilon subunit
MDRTAQLKKSDEKLSVLIRDRGGILYEGKVDSVSSFNDLGSFDVLPFHANFISLIKQSVSLRLRGKVVEELPIETGVMAVKENAVEVYMGILH